MPSARRLAAVVAAAVALAAVAVGGAVPAAAQEPRIVERERLLSSLAHERFEVRLADGSTARGNILRYRSDDPHLDLRPVLARDVVAGTETTPSMARRQRADRALAGTNGGYWLNQPPASPNGYAIQDGWLVAGQSQTGTGTHRARGVLGMLPDGGVLFDRLHVALDLRRPDATRVPVDEVNRTPRVGGDHPRSGELIAYEPIYGAPAPAPAGSRVLVVQGLRVPRSGSASGTVASIHAGGSSGTSFPIPAGGAVLVAHGDARPRLDGLGVGDTVSVRVRPAPLTSDATLWGQAVASLPGGPHLLRNGVITPEDGWSNEAFSHAHLHGRQPRTAVAATADGEILLVTVDGRRAGHSPGMTLRELVSFLRRLGARDAVNLDGGGSTTMTVGGDVRNRVSDPTPRSVANGLFVYHTPVQVTARDPRRHGCPPDRVPAARFTDIAGNTHEESITCLVWYGVTGGTTATTYTPGRAVTRAQMATFIANAIDYAAADGGRSLPDYDGDNRFRDVSGTHAPAVNRLAAAGIARGGPGSLPPDRYGPHQSVTRAQMATFIAGAIDYITGAPLPASGDAFADDHGSAHEGNINRLATAGVVHGREPGFYAPQAPVQRAAMASFLVRSLDLLVEQGVTGTP